MWRELESSWRDQNIIVRMPVSDRELAVLFSVYDDFNADTVGVSLDDFIACYALVNKKVKARRNGTPDDDLKM